MTTIAEVIEKFRKDRAPFEELPKITNEVERRASLYSPPQLIFTSTVVTELRSGLSTLQSAYPWDSGWASVQQQLLHVASLFGRVSPPFAITQQMVHRTIELIEACNQETYDGWTTCPRQLTQRDQDRVQEMVEALGPVVTSRPPDEARAWLIDLVAVAFFAPCTDALDDVDGDDDTAAILTRGLELAFSAAYLAGELWDQR